MAKAYSYIRFSSAKQGEGDSLRRQEKYAWEYAREHGLDLDTRSYRDLGVSAYKGLNASEGNLKLFLDTVDKSLIERGSYLLVESLDRLSRSHVQDALELLLSIIKRGIIVVTLIDKQVYSSESIKADRGISLIISITIMVRAHDESATKAARVKAAWNTKRDSGEIMTAMAPAWLKLSPDRKQWIVLPVKVKVVQRIFDLSSAGHGAPGIARQLNADKVPTMKSAQHWTFGTVNAILKNEAVIGRFTSKKVFAASLDNYFPEIVPPSTFRLVQEGMKNRRWIGGRNTENVTNLFAGYCFCYRCGSQMRIVGSSRQHVYLKCLDAYSNNGCSEGRFPYRAAEKAILHKMSDDLSYTMARRIDSENPLPALQLKRIDVQNRMTKIAEALEIASDVPELANRLAQLGKDLTQVENQIKTATPPSDHHRDRGDLNELFSHFRGEYDAMPIDVRRRVQDFLRRIIKDIQFWCDLENDRPTVAVNFREEYSTTTLYIDVKPWREKVGGNRRKIAAG